MLEQTENLPDPGLLAAAGVQVHHRVLRRRHPRRRRHLPQRRLQHGQPEQRRGRRSSPSSSRASWWPGAAVKGHQADIGGNVAGGYNPQATEVWQEALRIPPVKVYERGSLRKDVWDLIFANIRLDIVAEDMRAEIGSCVVGERGIHKILERYGREVFEAHKESLFDSTEQMMRNEIRTIPEGVYTGRILRLLRRQDPRLQVHASASPSR